MGPGGSMTTRRSDDAVVTRPRMRSGFTMIEVIIASAILGAALLAMAGFTVRYQQVDASARLVSRAQQAANERMEKVRTAQPYLSLDTMATIESSVAGYPGYMRQTLVTRVGGLATDTVDFKIVTVRVTTPGMPRSVVDGRCAIRPWEGFSPTRLVNEAGVRVLPPRSLDVATGTIPAATAAADPPLLPPGV